MYIVVVNFIAAVKIYYSLVFFKYASRYPCTPCLAINWRCLIVNAMDDPECPTCIAPIILSVIG